jgi:phosphoribosylformylglycinamidine cyclo-ligase
VPPIFGFLQERGQVPFEEMLRVFNLGVGMVLVTSADAVLPAPAMPIGRVVARQSQRVIVRR